MPWYMNPIATCKVLNRIANHYSHSSVREVSVIMDRVTRILWSKQEHYYEKIRRKAHSGLKGKGQNN